MIWNPQTRAGMLVDTDTVASKAKPTVCSIPDSMTTYTAGPFLTSIDATAEPSGAANVKGIACMPAIVLNDLWMTRNLCGS